MNSSFGIARIRGVEVRIHWSWVPILALLTMLSAVVPLSTREAASPAVVWAAALATSLLALGCVVLHELSHVAIARRFGTGSNTVVIQLLGGTYQLEARASSARRQFLLGVVGPLVSLVLFVAFSMIGVATMDGNELTPVSVAALDLALWNFFVAAVNLLPGYPLDGASIVRAIAWAVTHSEERATAITGRLGKRIGYALVVGSFLVLVFGDFFVAILVAFAGWMLAAGGAAIERRELLRNLVAGLLVGDALEADLPRVPPQLTLDTFAPDLLAEAGTAVLVSRPDEPLGIVGFGQARRNRRRWPSLHAVDLMTPLAQIPVVARDAELWPVLEQLEQSGLDAVSVADGDETTSVVTRRSAARAIHQRAQERLQAALSRGGMALQIGRRPRVFRGPGPRWPGATQPPGAVDDEDRSGRSPDQSDDDTGTPPASDAGTGGAPDGDAGQGEPRP